MAASNSGSRLSKAQVGDQGGGGGGLTGSPRHMLSTGRLRAANRPWLHRPTDTLRRNAVLHSNDGVFAAMAKGARRKPPSACGRLLRRPRCTACRPLQQGTVCLRCIGPGSWWRLGGLINYGPSVPDNFRRGAGYVDRILRASSSSDLPVQTARPSSSLSSISRPPRSLASRFRNRWSYAQGRVDPAAPPTSAGGASSARDKTGVGRRHS